MATLLSQEDKVKQGADDSGRYFRYMAEYVGFSQADVEAIQETKLVIEKYIPGLVAGFYAHLLRYPPTSKYFLKKDGTLDQEYLQLRMVHLTNFWRRTSSGVYDDDYARYIDYVGRAHTSHGADPQIYIAERYVIGQVGYMQQEINQALTRELHDIDPDLEDRAIQAWNTLMMVILEMLSRAYRNEREAETYQPILQVDHQAVSRLAVEAYEQGLGIRRGRLQRDVIVARSEEIPEGERKIIQVNGLSIGLFHHRGQWYAFRNSCLHRGGPVATGALEGDTITCPWHGFQYNVANGSLLSDPSAKLVTYPVTVIAGEVHLSIPDDGESERPTSVMEFDAPNIPQRELNENEFLAAEITPGEVSLVRVGGQKVLVINIGGHFYAVQNACSHAGGPLNEGELDGNTVICPWHASCFDLLTGKVLEGPADQPIATFQVHVQGEIGRVVELES